MSRPQVSVIVPCFNASATVAETIESVRRQTLPDWELIAVNDESADDTRAVLASLAVEDSRVRPIYAKHAGLCETRNRGIAAARAPFVFFLDADDLLRPEALELMLAAAHVSSEPTVVTAGWEWLTERGEPLGVRRFPSFPEPRFDAFLRSNRMTVMALVPTALLDERPFQALAPCADWDLWLRLAAGGANFVSVPRVLLGYRARVAGMSGSADAMLAAGLDVLDRWLPHASNPHDVRDARHRWAAACGALALACGDPISLAHYVAALPTLRMTPTFAHSIAHAIEWAFSRTGAAVGHTWRSHGDEWAVRVDHWLAQGPLASIRDDALNALATTVRSFDADVDHLAEILNTRQDIGRLLIYGVGTRGQELIAQLRADRRFTHVQFAAADDYAPAAVFNLLDIEQVTPSTWTNWPDDTLAIIAANDPTPMRAKLVDFGAQPDREFVILGSHTGPRLTLV